MRFQLLDFFVNTLVLAGQEARADAISFRPEPQVETRRLELTLIHPGRRLNHAATDHDFKPLLRE